MVNRSCVHFVADLAVAIGREIEFFSRDRMLTGQAKIAQAVSLAGMAYDDATHTMYFSDKRSAISVFSNDLTNKNFTSTPLFRSEYADEQALFVG